MTAPRPQVGARHRRRRFPAKTLAGIAVGIAIALMVGLSSSSVTGQVTCSRGSVRISVSASTDIAPAITRIAQAFNRQQHTAGGQCAQVRVSADSPAATAAQIDGQSDGQGAGQSAGGGRAPVDAWIPDSSLWVDNARRFPLGAQRVQPAGFGVARSPLLLVMPSAAAARTRAFAKAGWGLLLPASAGGPAVPAGFRVDLPDPAQNAAGLATLVEVGRVLGPGADTGVNFTRFARAAAVTSYFGDPIALRSFVRLAAPPLNGDPVTITSEQALVAYDRIHPTRPLAARYPAGSSTSLGSPELDYPYVLTTSVKQRLDAATQFGQLLRSGYASGVIRYAGFRSAADVPDAFPAGSGLGSQWLQVAPPAAAGVAPAALTSWNRLAEPSRVLAVMDVSGGMAGTISPGGATFGQVMAQTGTLWLDLYPDSTSFGLWAFADQLAAGQPYQQLVPGGALPASMGQQTRREQLRRAIAGLNPATGTAPALYRTILAAYQQMRSGYQPGYVNSVIVFTSGAASARDDISAADLISKLTALASASPDRPVSLIIVAFSGPAGFGDLQRVAQETGGQAFEITDPAQVGQVFYQALARRLCSFGCVAP